MISLDNILDKSAFRQFNILPLTGIRAWNALSLASLQAPKAESPSTIKISLSNGILLLQSTNFLGLFPNPILLLKLCTTFLLTLSASSRAVLFASTSVNTLSACLSSFNQFLI